MDYPRIHTDGAFVFGDIMALHASSLRDTLPSGLIPLSPTLRKSLASAVTREQLSLQLGLPLSHAEPILHSPVVLTQGPRTTRRHLFLFRDWLVIAKQR
ncbi:hypothetical protein P7K49_008881 [Saguinus oedipus]|uniref:ARHGAP20 PH domain-containing protein n=1 Tax=Saguinus oedipus TaxID=9490 RepID=A0ABQ9VZQ6_SAGOE|nr:hypothetical protein P7K49_008881 [Saguinus oedipus]